MPPVNDWNEYKKLILQNQEDTKICLKEIDDKIDKFYLEFITLRTRIETKSKMYGAISGGIVSLVGIGIGVLIQLLLK